VAVAADRFLTFGWNVIDDGGEVVGGAEDLEIGFALPGSAGAVEDGFGVGVRSDFLEGERGSDEVLRQSSAAFQVGTSDKVGVSVDITSLKLMIPFCRTLDEGRKVKADMEKHCLKRGQDRLELYVMCEIPSNVILAEEFPAIFDGFSIGPNELTQLIFGVDRDSEIVAPLFDEPSAAVKTIITWVIAVCSAKGRKIGICSQAPSD